MSRTIYGNLTGRAAALEIRDQRDYIAMVQDQERRRIFTEQKKNERAELYAELSYLYGQTFVDWYDSDAVPQFAPASEHIKLMQSWVSDHGAGVLQARRAAIMHTFQTETLNATQLTELVDELAEIEIAIKKTGETS